MLDEYFLHHDRRVLFKFILLETHNLTLEASVTVFF